LRFRWPARQQNVGTSATDGQPTGISIDNAGSGSAHNVQPTMMVNKVVRI
jgi:hypothetical protein